MGRLTIFPRNEQILLVTLVIHRPLQAKKGIDLDAVLGLTMAQDVNGNAHVDNQPISTDLCNLQLFVYFF